MKEVGEELRAAVVELLHAGAAVRAAEAAAETAEAAADEARDRLAKARVSSKFYKGEADQDSFAIMLVAGELEGRVVYITRHGSWVGVQDVKLVRA